MIMMLICLLAHKHTPTALFEILPLTAGYGINLNLTSYFFLFLSFCYYYLYVKEYGDINFPFAQAHADFVANTVKPLIDNRFRTDPSPEHNFVIGSSLGGQASLHLMMRHPDKFGGAACLSPAFGPAMLDYVASTKGQNILRNKNGGCPKKLYIDIGGDMPKNGKSDDDTFVRVSPIDVLDHLTPVHGWNPGYFWLDTQLQGQVTAMKNVLDKGGIDYQFRQYPGARHNERAWALRIDKPLQHLLSS
ncbi:MAG: pimeloyl-ACP methyl ester carboxylesterase [Bacillariaceae sp.]|jgi:pimeloyl-ACP methyl ester carboxylesterase